MVEQTRVTSSFHADEGFTMGSPANPIPVGPIEPATPSEIGGVLKGVAVANATDTTDVITNFNALLASLRDSGAIATS